MEPASWNIVVFADLGAEHDGRIAVDPAQPGEWLGRLDATVTVKPLGFELRLSDRLAFDPAAWAKRLAGEGPWKKDAGSPEIAPAAFLDALYQNPDYRRIESAFRGISLIGEHAGGAVGIEVVSAPRAALAARFRETVWAPAMEGEITPPALVLFDFDFSHQPNDLALLMELSAMAAEIPCPIVAGASPALFGMRYWAHVAGIADLATAWMDAAHAPWREFQASDAARWAALTMNRYLQRPPAELESAGYREAADEARPESFLWGRGIWLVGAALARSVRAHGHALDLAGRGGAFTGLPSRPYPHMGDPVALAAEAPLPEMKASEAAWAGLTPLVGVLRQDAVVLPMAVTLFRLKPGRLTIEGTLAYQITTGRIAQDLNTILPQLTGERNEAPAFLQARLAETLGPLLGPNAAEALRVAWLEAAAGEAALEVRITPPVPLEGKQAEFLYRLPWRGAPAS